MRSRKIFWLMLSILATLTNVSFASYWATKSGNFSDPATWGENTPGSGDGVVVADDYTVTVDNNQGALDVRAVYAGYLNAVWSQSEGFMVMDDPNASLTARFLFIASNANSNGRFTQNAGTVSVIWDGEGGYFSLKQSAGLHEGDLAWAEYVLNGGQLLVDGMAYVGYEGKATFIQNGGNFTPCDLTIGYGNKASLGENTDVARYILTGGSLTINDKIYMAYAESASAEFTMGDADSSGEINGSGNLYIKLGDKNGTASLSTCTFQGWGDVNLTGALLNSGKVIANSWSDDTTKADRDLNMSSFQEIANEGFTRVTGAGWYATNRGRLILPSLTVASGSSTKDWGISATSTLPGMINSVVMNFNNVAGGTLAVSLLANDRSDVGLANQKMIGVWNFDGSNFAFGNGSVSMTFKYDDVAATTLGLTEANLKAYAKVAGTWTEVTAMIDTTTHQLTISNQTAFTTIAIGEIVAQQVQGDANGDGAVDVSDLGILAANYGMTSGATLAQGDFNGDGAVDVSDLGILAANYGTGTQAGADFNADYAKVFGAASEENAAEDTTSSTCSSLGLSLMVSLTLLGLMLVKLD